MDDRRTARAGGVFGFGLGGLVDGIVLHQILRWHHLVSDDVSPSTVDGLERNLLADGLFHLATVVVVVVGAVLLWRVPRTGSGRAALAGVAIGFGAFHVVDEVVFHVALDLHHIRMVDDHLVYDLVFLAAGLVLIAAGTLSLRRQRVVGHRPRA